MRSSVTMGHGLRCLLGAEAAISNFIHWLISRITHFEGQVIALFDGVPAGTSRAL
jgi:hypothetical protein